MKGKIIAIVASVIGLIVAAFILYGGKHFIHAKCIEESLAHQCKQTYAGFQGVKAIDVAWWNPLAEDYPCTATLEFATGDVRIFFKAKVAGLSDALEDDWDVSFSIWGWLGDDYRVMGVRKL